MLSMFQALNAGRIISKELLFKDVAAADRAREGERAALGFVDWERNGDPDVYLHTRLAPVPVARWPLWRNPPRSPEDRLLALGILDEGAPAVAEHFPASDPALSSSMISSSKPNGTVWTPRWLRSICASDPTCTPTRRPVPSSRLAMLPT